MLVSKHQKKLQSMIHLTKKRSSFRATLVGILSQDDLGQTFRGS